MGGIEHGGHESRGLSPVEGGAGHLETGWSCVRARGLAGVLRSLRGTAAGWRAGGGAKRRGSFLVIVVGTLALLSVFAVLYMAIGNQDMRAQAARDHRKNLDDVPRQFARYIAQDIVARDVLARWYPTNAETGGIPNRPVGWREVTDYPSVEWTRRSNSTTADAFFDPVGTFDPPDRYQILATTWPLNSYAQRVIPTDPWLAALEPVWLNYAGSPLAANTPEYLMRRDWAAITNVAPDGRFVNLYNLAPMSGPARAANFNALPGVGNDPSGLPRLSTSLSLFNATGNTSQSTDFGESVSGALAAQTPAFWTLRQLGAFRPLSLVTDPGPGSPDWPQYQWADADGDGMLDSRWFEMTDWREQGANQPGSNVVNLLETDGSIRYFFAARIVDLSGLVNVNTAGDLRAAPNVVAPVGLTPADVDLRRLLTLQDRVDEDAALPPASLRVYDGMFQPQPAGGADRAADYTAYDVPAAFATGRHGYTALRLGLEAKITPGTLTPDGANRYSAPDGVLETDFATNHGLQPPTFAADFATNPSLRANMFVRQAAGGGVGVLPSVTLPPYQLIGNYGVMDLAELLTFRATNNPSIRSNLELTLGGRNDTTGYPLLGATAFSPLRDNRHLMVESRRDFGSAATTQQTLLHFAADVRQRLTTLSGARDLRNTRDADAYQLNAAELKIDLGTTLPGASALFSGYASGLLPNAQPGWWNNVSGSGAERMTEFYGGQGPELAARIAAHMAVNATDAFDAGSVSTAYTLALDVRFPSNGQGGPEIQDLDRALPLYDTRSFPAAHEGRLFNLGANRLANGAAGGSDATVAPAINVHGIEAQPFITQVSTFAVYTDAPADVLGADDETQQAPPRAATINGTIDASNPDFLYAVVAFQLTNPFGVDVTLSRGSFPEETRYNAIDLQSSDFKIDREADFYYIEWGGRYFKCAALEEQVYVTAALAAEANSNGSPALGNDAEVGEFVPSGAATLAPIVIPAGQSVALYFMSQMPSAALERVQIADVTLRNQPIGDRRATIENLVENQFRGADIANAYLIPEFVPDISNAGADPTLRLPTTLQDPLVSTSNVVNLYRAVRVNDPLVSPATQGEAAMSRPGNARSPADAGISYWDGVTAPGPGEWPVYLFANKIENDRLMDRFRVVAGSLNNRIPVGPNDITGTVPIDPADQQGFTVALWANNSRPSDPGADLAVRKQVFPAYCLEPKYVVDWNEPTRLTFALDRGSFSGSSGGASNTIIGDWRDAMSTVGIPSFNGNKAPTQASYAPPPVGTGTRVNPLIPSTANYALNYAQILLPDGNTTGPNALASPVRLGDLLLPLGIGPCEKPLIGPGITDLETDDVRRYTTLGEAMAVALGYEGMIPVEDPMFVYTPQPDPSGSGNLLLPLDRGNLRLDAFVPFFDANTNGLFEPPPTGSDRRRGMEIPAAMAVLDAFTTLRGDVQSLTQGRDGVVNINTAPLSVMRTLPMLSPPPDLDPAGMPWWWPVGPTGEARITQTSDVAATVTAYRDKVDTILRPASVVAPFPNVITFADTVSGTPVPPNSPYDQLNGRFTFTEITGIGEAPGIRSVGELMAVRFRTGGVGDEAFPSSIDFTGFDTTGGMPPGNNSRAGVSSMLVTPPGGGAAVPDRIANEYAEKLAIFNAVAGSVTTRSDLYACWFVVQGYKRGDLENLKPQDAMTPSVKRRFLMVLDRSGVTRRGDAAEVVYFQEVPVTAQ